MQPRHTAKNNGILIIQCIEALGAAAVYVGQQHGGHTGIYGTLHSLRPVGVEGFVVEVAVCVDEGHRSGVLLYQFCQ